MKPGIWNGITMSFRGVFVLDKSYFLTFVTIVGLSFLCNITNGQEVLVDWSTLTTGNNISCPDGSYKNLSNNLTFDCVTLGVTVSGDYGSCESKRVKSKDGNSFPVALIYVLP